MENGTSGAKPNLSGLILTGGRSTRMGRDKSLLAYHGKPQREYLTALLDPFCQTVYWSVNADQASTLTPADPPAIVDAFDLPGPLNGILSAFHHNPNAAWLVVACDMPLLTEKTIGALVAGRNPAKRATAFYDSDGQFPEPLLSIWEPTMVVIIAEAREAGYYSPRHMLMLADCQLLTVPEPRALLNINDPAGLDALKHQAGSGGSSIN